MPRASKAPRGYALMSVVVITVLILAGAAILLSIGKEAELTGIKEKRATEAHGVAMAGLQWMLANMNSPAGKDQAVEAATGTAVAVPPAGVLVHPFVADDPWAGVLVAPPAVGTSTTHWTAVGRGHYGLLAALDPLDLRRSVLIRSIGVVGDTQVVLEANLQLNVTQTVPSGLTGCFDPTFHIAFSDREGPYDYSGNLRLDGTNGVPMGISTDNDHINGFAKDGASATPVVGAAPQGRQWRGTQTLRGGPLAQGTVNPWGGAPTTSFSGSTKAPLAGWEQNAFLANDPRLVDDTGLSGLALNGGGGVYDGNGTPFSTGATSTGPRGLPEVAFKSGPTVPVAAPELGSEVLGQTEWTAGSDAAGVDGTYGCADAAGGATAAVELCVKGTAGAAAPDWTAAGVYQSGRAWNVVSMVLRHCTGSGDAIDRTTGAPWFDAVTNPHGVICENGWNWLENVAACLVLPDSVAGFPGTNARRPPPSGPLVDDFDGCHPGCLLATDVTGDGDVTAGDHPFRSSCINLDPGKVTTYGPGAMDDGPTSPAGTDFPQGDPYESQGGTAAGDWTEWNASVNGGGLFVPANTTPRFKVKGGGATLLGGAVRERGHPDLITRLDLSDRGPLGTCEQNCVAYGYGKDETYGAHRTDLGVPGGPGVAATAADVTCTAKVPDDTAPGPVTYVSEPCNFDVDNDGLLDRKSYALFSSYREECADTHDGVPYVAAVNIASTNPNLGGTGCSTRLPGWSPDAAAQRLLPFCEDGNDAEVQEGIARLEAQATDITADLSPSTQNLTDGRGWFGGARCHMGAQARFDGSPLVHPHAGHLAGVPDDDVDRLGRPDYWIEDTCPRPVILKIGNNANLSLDNTCGCGILIFEDNSLKLNKDAVFLWRGLVVWNFKTAGGTKDFSVSGAGGATFVVEGAVLMTGPTELKWVIDKPLSTAGGTDVTSFVGTQPMFKQMFRLNEKALEDAFGAVKAPARSIRRVR